MKNITIRKLKILKHASRSQWERIFHNNIKVLMPFYQFIIDVIVPDKPKRDISLAELKAISCDSHYSTLLSMLELIFIILIWH